MFLRKLTHEFGEGCDYSCKGRDGNRGESRPPRKDTNCPIVLKASERGTTNRGAFHAVSLSVRRNWSIKIKLC